MAPYAAVRERKFSVMLTRMTQRWPRMLLAILLGNLVYFLWLPHLPNALRHETYRIDPGLFLDLLLCVLIYQPVRKL